MNNRINRGHFKDSNSTYVWCKVQLLFTLTHAYCPKPTLPEIDPRPTCSWKIRKDKHGCEEYKEVCNPTVPSSKICLMDKKPGRCRGHLVRYYYDEKSGKCEQFIYGGCDGNHNNFETLKQCREACGLVSHIRMISAHTNLTEVERKKREMIYWTPKNKDCMLPSDSGKCLAHFPKFYFNPRTRQCEQFIYGGCGGNKNSFDTQQACENACGQKITDERNLVMAQSICNLRKDSGPCEAYVPSFYYDMSSGQCLPFVYGGCGGNKNRFETMNECRKSCEKGISKKPYGEKKCPKNEEFFSCGTACEPSCENPKPQICKDICKIDVCQCKNGTVRHKGKCISKEDCPQSTQTF